MVQFTSSREVDYGYDAIPSNELFDACEEVRAECDRSDDQSQATYDVPQRAQQPPGWSAVTPERVSIETLGEKPGKLSTAGRADTATAARTYGPNNDPS